MEMSREEILHLGVMISDVAGDLSHVLELVLAVRTLLPVLSQQIHQLGLVVTVGVVTVETFPPLQTSLSTQTALLPYSSLLPLSGLGSSTSSISPDLRNVGTVTTTFLHVGARNSGRTQDS